MKTYKFIFYSFFICAFIQLNAQNEHELSFNAGIYQLRSDYGINNDSETNFGNQGVSLSLNYYYNKSYRGGRAYFNKHFKYRGNLIFSTVNLEHFGPDADDPRLASMTGSSNIFTIGNSLEYYPLGIETRRYNSFNSFLNNLSPYASIGLGVNFVSSDAESSLSGGINNIDNVFPTFISESDSKGINTDSEVVLSLLGNVGVRYKVNNQSDILLESTWMFFDSDLVDGLSPVGPQNKNKDWSWGISIGYTYMIF